MSHSSIQAVGLDAVILRFGRLPGRIRTDLEAAVTEQTILTHAVVVEGKLSGQVLSQRSGKLWRSIFNNVVVSGDRILGTVGANMDEAKYARFWEYGFKGTEQVSEYRRYILGGAARSERGQLRALKAASGLSATKKTRLKRLLNISMHADRLINSGDIDGSVLVKAHKRDVNQAARSYLRSALADRADDIRAGLTQAVSDAAGAAP